MLIEAYKLSKPFFYITSMISPLGNRIGKITSPATCTDSLQCINVSSKSNIKVFLSNQLINFVITLMLIFSWDEDFLFFNYAL